MEKLPKKFYERRNVVVIAKELLGKILVTNFDGQLTSGRIVETEAYNGVIDRAAHSFGGRRTNRNEVMYGEGGYSYVYLCYGIHYLFNVVTNLRDVPHAILVRALEPMEGIDIMLDRTRKTTPDHSLTRGPGNVSKALGITREHNALPLSGESISIQDDGFRYPKSQVVASPRIGVDYAGDHALLPYRFYVKDSPYVSGRNFKSKWSRDHQ